MRMTPQTRVDMPIIIIILLTILAVTLVTARYARADIITCEHVRQASLITGHTAPRLIARALGLKLTDAQIAEASKCLSPHTEKK